MKKRSIAILLISSLVISLLCGCSSNKDKSTEGGNINDLAQVWAVVASEKVMATQSVDKYSDYVQDEITLNAVKNEYENGQIVISAKKDVSFSVAISDLVSDSNPSVKISNSNFKAYIEKYIYVPRNLNQNGEPSGDYPDAIIPQDVAIEYGENKIAQGHNGTAWLEFYIPKKAKAGAYSGSVTVTVNDAITQIPVKLNVYDYVLSDETTSKSVFLIQKSNVEEFELDSTQEMLDKYTQFFVDHRLSALSVKDSSMTAYVDKCCEFVQKGLSTISIKGGSTTGLQYNTFDADGFVDCILQFASRSVVDKINYVSKLVYYNNWIDEPWFLPRGNGIVQFQIDRFDNCLELAKASLMSDPAFSSSFGKEIIASVDDIEHVITDYYEQDKHRANGPLKNADGSLFSYDGQNVVLCPKPDGLNSVEERANYEQFKDKWVYTCNNPVYPYSTYHIDAYLVDALALGWMMGEYDLTGNLYWSVNLHYDANNEPVDNVFAGANRTSGANGDGWLCYPGKEFGIEGLISTVRLEAIRDANEDYELIQDIKKKYSSKGEDASSVISAITSSVYTGTQMTGDANAYENARISLLELAECAYSDCELTVSNIEKTENAFVNGEYVIEVKVSDGTSVYQNGKQILPDGSGRYKFGIILNQDKNYISVTAVKGNTTVAFNLYLGGKVSSLGTSSFSIAMFEDSITSGILQNDGWYDIVLKNGGATRMVLKDAFFDSIGENTKDCKFYFYNPSQNGVPYKVYVDYSGFGKVEVMSGELNNGENAINLSMFSSVNWHSRKSVKTIEFYFGTTEIKMGSIFIYDK